MRTFIQTSTVLLPVLSLWNVALAEEGPVCARGDFNETTDDFLLSASAAQGAVGDVVAVEVRLTIENLRPGLAGIHAFGCFEKADLELVGEPLWSETFESIAYMTFSYSFTGDVGPQGPQGAAAFGIITNVFTDRAESIFPSREPLPIATLFFRVLGQVGEDVPIRFCDGEFVLPSGACVDNTLDYIHEDGVLLAHSTRHVPATIRILPGEPTHPDPPPLPPSAKVYPEPPTPESARIAFELSGSVARPGATGVPLDLVVASSHEFCGYMVSLSYPPDLLEIAGVDEKIRPGVVAIDNIQGSLGLLMNDSTRRVGAEGERVEIATIRVNLKEAAASAGDIELMFEDRGNYINWLGIRHRQGIGADQLPYTAEVTPIILDTGILRIQASPTTLGDVNLDYSLDVTDAVALLGHLFQGGDPVTCAGAADVNADGRVDISDPIEILNRLFLGGGGGGPREVFCDD